MYEPWRKSQLHTQEVIFGPQNLGGRGTSTSHYGYPPNPSHEGHFELRLVLQAIFKLKGTYAPLIVSPGLLVLCLARFLDRKTRLGVHIDISSTCMLQ